MRDLQRELRIRKPLLYPAELRVLKSFSEQKAKSIDFVLYIFSKNRHIKNYIFFSTKTALSFIMHQKYEEINLIRLVFRDRLAASGPGCLCFQPAPAVACTGDAGTGEHPYMCE
jgi:hypothetical protein